MKTSAGFTAATMLLAGSADAFWRMPCRSRTGYSRIDPIVNPGEVSTHAHAIHGGGNFGMDTKYADLRASKCTSCAATDDKSAYWTPGLQFQYKNGTTVLVPQVGGMLAYYLLRKNDKETIEAFPDGFQMIAGDNRLRNFTGAVPDPERSLWGEKDKTQFALGQKAIGMNCLNYKRPAEPSIYRHFLPDKAYLDANCADGIRAELFFPSCWNGKLDSDNHRDHVAYPDLTDTGKCPKGFERRIPSLFFETIWATNAFVGQEGTFVFANGDPTGFGYHGDFMNGWSKEVLQKAIDTCHSETGKVEDCPAFKLQSDSDAAKCKFEEPKELKGDQCQGPAKGLCGNVEVQYGPKYASALVPGNSATPTAKPSTQAPTQSQVPTLSHTSAKSQNTDAITVASVKASDAPAPSSPSPTPKKNDNAIDVGIKKESSSSSSSSAAPAAPAPTKAPVAAQEPSAKIVGTSTYTSAGAIYRVVLEEVEITVTASAPAAASAKANARRHAHAHAHHMHHLRH